MPVRTNPGEAPSQPVLKPVPAQPTAEKDPWDQLNDMTGKAGKAQDEDGFDRMNTNFYLLDGETSNIVFLSETPKMFLSHNMQRYAKSGKVYYETVPCQKSHQASCQYCLAGFPTRQQVGFTILDGRGKYIKDTKQFDKSQPSPKIFLTSVVFAKIISKCRQEVGGAFSNYLFELSKANKAYNIKQVLEPRPGGGFDLKKLNGQYTGPVPNAEVVFTPDDNETADYIIANSAPPAGRQAQVPGPPASAGNAYGAQPAPAATHGNGGLFS